MSEVQIYEDSVRASGDGTEQVRSHSPFQNILADILVEICLQAITPYDDSRVDVDDKSLYSSQFTRKKWAKAVPVNVSTVCQHWRAVALSSPILWTTFAGCDDGDISFPWEYLDMFLLRSRNAPFNLTIRSCDMAYARLLTIFNNNLTRLKTVDIDCSWNGDFEEHWHIELVTMPSLETFQLQTLGGYNSLVHVHLADVPLLHHLSLGGCVALYYDEQLAFENLTHISLSVMSTANIGVSWHDCLSIMQASPCLETFIAEDIWLRGNTTDSNLVEDESCITLSKLANLKLKWLIDVFARRPLRHPLDHLCLPSLTEVSLQLGVEEPSCGLQSLISRSKAAIRELRVARIDAVDVALCLECTPELRTLSVSGYDFNSPDLRTIISRLTLDSDTRLCLNLESIAFMGCGDPCQCSEELTTMICSRWDRTMVGDERRLKTVEFEDFCMDWDFHYSDELLKACREGLVIHEKKGLNWPLLFGRLD